MKLPYDLTESEMAMLEALIDSPAYKVLRKIVKGESDKLLNMLRTESSITEINRVQGRIVGTEAIANIPLALVTHYRQQRLGLKAKPQSPKKHKI